MFNLSIRPYKNISPTLAEGVYIDESAVVIGNVTIGRDSSVWPHTTIRGDMHHITIGERCSIQDNSVLHITHDSDSDPGGWPLTLGDDVTVGHSAVLHGCTIGNRVLVGIGAKLMDGVVVEDEVMIGAGALVPPGKTLKSGFVYMGTPCKSVRPVSDAERDFFTYGTANYVKLKNEYLAAESD